jgi:hypothetical protein
MNSSLPQARERRNTSEDHLDLPHFTLWPTTSDNRDLSPGGRIVHRRTRWSPSLRNTVAALAGLDRQEG